MMNKNFYALGWLCLVPLVAACSKFAFDPNQNCLNKDASCFVKDVTAPVVASSTPALGAVVQQNSDFQTIQFSEPVNGADRPSSYTFGGVGGAGIYVSAVTKTDDQTYQIAVAGGLNSGPVTLAFPGVTDWAGNAATATLAFTANVGIVITVTPSGMPAGKFYVSNAGGTASLPVTWQGDLAIDQYYVYLYPIATACPATLASTNSTGANAAGSVAAATPVASTIKASDLSSGPGDYNVCIFAQKISPPKTGSASVVFTRDDTAPVVTASYPASSTSVNTTQVSYTLSKTCNTGSIVWTRTAGAADGASPHTQALVAAELTAGAHSNIIITNNPSLVASATYSIAFQCTDYSGNASAIVTQTNVTYDNVPPTVTNVTSSQPNGNYPAATLIPIQVTFSKGVIVTGTPQLSLATTAPPTTAVNYVSGSGTTTLTFNYTIAPGNNAPHLDYTSAAALGLNGGTIQDAATNAAVLTLANPGAAGSLGANKNIVVDTQAPTVAIKNFRNNGVVQSGFAIGTATDNIAPTSVLVQTDGGAFTAPTGLAAWSYKLPLAWKQNSVHTIGVKAADAAGNTSLVTTISVRKGMNHDANGDGYADVALHADGTNTNAGVVFIFHSTGTAGLATTTDASANATLTGTSPSDLFGGSGYCSWGDINGDGYGDLVVGANGVSSHLGKAYIFYSTGPAGIASTAAASAGTVLTGTVAGGYFGQIAATGDFNGDGFADVAISAPYANYVYIFHSPGVAGIASATASAATANLSGGSGYFGWTIAAGDVNGDGFADLTVGLPWGAGAHQYIFHSAGAPGIASGTQAGANTIITGTVGGDNFAASSTLGDVNGDGYADLIVGASLNNGAAYIYHSTGATGVASANQLTANTTITGTIATNTLANSISVGDIDGDGYGDLILPSGGSAGGRLFIFKSGGGTGIASANDVAATTVLTGASNNFSASFTVTDLTGDGYFDVLVGDNTLQKAYFFPSLGATGITSGNQTTATATLTGTAPLSNTGFTYGMSQ
ncbi:MAG: FG-GAP repeat protein [Spirochaetes bacterium]|nr:FG-GAP repeat protein [Spirochaetota bacterium]